MNMSRKYTLFAIVDHIVVLRRQHHEYASGCMMYAGLCLLFVLRRWAVKEGL